MAEKKLTFEQAMSRLDEIVSRMEAGEAPLEESLALFEEGTQLVRRCTSMLDQAELKVTKLTVSSEGEPVEIPFENPED